MRRPAALAWLFLAIQISMTWALIRLAPPNIDTGVEFVVPGLIVCEEDNQGRTDLDCLTRRTRQVEDYLAQHDVVGADQRHGPIVWIEAFIGLLGGVLVFGLSRGSPAIAFAASVYLVGFAAGALGPPTFLGLLIAATFIWLRGRMQRVTK